MTKIAGMALAALFFAAPALAAEDEILVAEGETLYEAHCSECHGERLRNPGQSFDLRELRAEERVRFDTSVLNGKNQMPPWRGTLGSVDLDRLWAYIRSRAYE